MITIKEFLESEHVSPTLDYDFFPSTVARDYLEKIMVMKYGPLETLFDTADECADFTSKYIMFNKEELTRLYNLYKGEYDLLDTHSKTTSINEVIDKIASTTASGTSGGTDTANRFHSSFDSSALANTDKDETVSSANSSTSGNSTGKDTKVSSVTEHGHDKPQAEILTDSIAAFALTFYDVMARMLIEAMAIPEFVIS